MPKNDLHYYYIAIPSVENWFEMHNESLDNIKKAAFEFLQKDEIVEGCKIVMRRYSTDYMFTEKYIVWNKSKTSVKLVKAHPMGNYKVVIDDDILIELKKLYQTFDHKVMKFNDNTYLIHVKDKYAEQFKKDFIQNHKVKAKQVTINKTCDEWWVEQKDDGTYCRGDYNWVVISWLNELKVKIS